MRRTLRVWIAAVCVCGSVALAYWQGAQHGKTHHVYDGAEFIYRSHYPPISNRDTASDVLRHFGDNPKRKQEVGRPGVSTQRWTFTNGKNWIAVVEWIRGPEPEA